MRKRNAIYHLALEQTKPGMPGPLAQFDVTVEIAFGRGAVWAVNRITAEQIAEVIEREVDMPLSSRLAVAHSVLALLRGEGAMDDYTEIFGREPEPWREPLGALRITLTGDPSEVDVRRAQHEVEELVRVLNGVEDNDR